VATCDNHSPPSDSIWIENRQECWIHGENMLNPDDSSWALMAGGP
jgi:hypothetical protein